MVEKGMMEKSALGELLNRMSRLGHLFSCNNIKAELIQKYCRMIDEMLKLLRPLLDEVADSDIAADEQLTKRLEELDLIVNEAMELVESWHQMTSKIYFVLRVESLVANIQKSMLETCRLLCYLLSASSNSSSASAQHCIQKVQHTFHGQTSDIIRDAIRNRKENSVPSSGSLVRIADSLSLTSNQELIMEAIALEKVKSKANKEKNNGKVEYIDHIISLVTYMHECLVKIKLSRTINGVPIPVDFCCPLSLELMSDPVIIASGQTYERAFIQKWLDHGRTACPKTRQTLAHTNLITNYTVKVLIVNWCDSNNVKLPDPMKSTSLNHPSTLLAWPETGATDSHISITVHSPKTNPISRYLDSTWSMASHKSLGSLNGGHLEAHANGTQNSSPSPHHRPGLSSDVGNCSAVGTARISYGSSEDQEVNHEDENVCSSGQTLVPSRKFFSEGSSMDGQFHGHIRSTSVSSAVLSTEGSGAGDITNFSQGLSDLAHYSSNVSGEVSSETPDLSTPHEEPAFPSRLAETLSRSQTIWRRPSEQGFVPRIVSSSALDTTDLSGLETRVRKLVEDLQSSSEETQRAATAELRLLAKHSRENRIIIANCGAINPLVGLLHSPDPRTQKFVVTALLNLSINDNNKAAIANAGAIEPLIHVLRTGNPEAKENSAATLYNLSVIDENKIKIGRSEAIKPLVELLGNGSPRGKKDAATALFNLSISHENKARVLQAGAVKHLVDLMDPAAGMVDKAVAVLANLATTPEGCHAIVKEGGIPGLVDVVELGSSRGKENAAATLLLLCHNKNQFYNMVLQEGAVPPLVALSQSGTPRAKEKIFSSASRTLFQRQLFRPYHFPDVTRKCFR